jgi:hypothetical protein
VFNAVSRLEIKYDIEIVDNINAYCLEDTNVPTTVHFTGRIRHVTSLPVATSGIWRNNNVGGLAVPGGTFRELVMETNCDYIMIGAGPSLANINCIGAYANKGFNPALHAAAIEPLTVSPSVTV